MSSSGPKIDIFGTHTVDVLVMDEILDAVALPMAMSPKCMKGAARVTRSLAGTRLS